MGVGLREREAFFFLVGAAAVFKDDRDLFKCQLPSIGREEGIRLKTGE